MSYKTEAKTINGNEYSVTIFPARAGLKYQTRLVKLVAPLALSTGENVDSSSAMSQILTRLDEDMILNLVFELLSLTRRNDKEITESEFNKAYAGNYKELFEALVFVSQVNNFFQGIDIGKLVSKKEL